MLESIFYSTQDVMKLFGLKSPQAAQKLMKDWEVPCCFLGVGRKRGYRWKKEDVQAAIDSRMIFPTEQKKPAKPVSDGMDFWNQELSKIKSACARM